MMSFSRCRVLSDELPGMQLIKTNEVAISEIRERNGFLFIGSGNVFK